MRPLTLLALIAACGGSVEPAPVCIAPSPAAGYVEVPCPVDAAAVERDAGPDVVECFVRQPDGSVSCPLMGGYP